MNITFSPKKRQGPNYVNAKTFLFWRFAKWDPVFLNVPKNAEKYAKILFHNMSRPVCGRCLVGHIADKRGHMETCRFDQKTLEKTGSERR